MKTPRSQVILIADAVRRRFIWVILGSYVVAALLPGPGLWIRSAGVSASPAQPLGLQFSLPALMLGVLLFNAGLGVDANDLKILSQKSFVLWGGVAANLATPLAFILALSVLLRPWHNGDEVQQILVGLALIASMPIAGSSTAWAQNADGDLGLSLGLILLTTALSPVFTPLVLHAVGLVTTGDYSEDLHELASRGVGSFLGIWVILPSVLGVGARWITGRRWMSAAGPYIRLVNYTVLVLLNYANASLTLPEAVARPDPDLLVMVVTIALGLCITAFTAGSLLASVFRAGRPARVSLLFGLGMNNNGAGLVLASMALAHHPRVMLPIIFYNLLQHLVASVVDFAMVRRRTD
jgi:BASS family bile acid:Na+ symporter